MNRNQDVRARHGRTAKLTCNTAFAVAAILAAAAQAAAPADELQEIIVTGTSIRGVAPVGANVITIDREAIEATGAQTMQQILSSVPSVTGFGNAAQGDFGSADGAGTFAPTIHGLGASASNQTLILIDGRRLPLSGINHTLADPTVIAPLAIERVEVLSEGASAVYGSDATAGVLNFITRRRFNGFEATGQATFGDEYSGHNIGAIWGNTWDTGSVMASYNFSNRSNLAYADRDFTRADQRYRGGGNFATFDCGPATMQGLTGNTAQANNVYSFPYSGAPIPVGNGQNGTCDPNAAADLLPESDRHNMLVKIEKSVGDALTLTADIVYSKQTIETAISRGNVSLANVWGSGAPTAGQNNPFFDGGTSGLTAGRVNFRADELLGPGARQNAGAEAFFVSMGAEYELPGDWVGSLGFTTGKDDSFQRRTGALCTSCAVLALNGTTLNSGSATSPSTPGSSTIVLNTPLTTANALDVWRPRATNRTSQAVLTQLTDSEQVFDAHQTMRDYVLKFDGPLFGLPGGDVRAAVGAEYIIYDMNQEVQRAGNTGPASRNSTTTFLDYGRDVTSAFLEVLVPIVGPDNQLPLVRRLDFNVSGRYDDYSDFGDTTNPKYALTWQPVNGLSIRANYSESFTAPALTSRGNANGTTAESSIAGGPTASIPVSIYPLAAQLPGCATATNCNVGGASGISGIQINGGNKDLVPQTGESYSFGFDFAPAALPGLRISATYWNIDLLGGITAPQITAAMAAPGLNQLVQIYPTPLTPNSPEIQALIAAGLNLNVSLPAQIYYTYSFQQRNAFNVFADGIDAEVQYRFDTGIGAFNVGAAVSRKLGFDQQFGDGPIFDVLNTVGINTTFPSNKMAGRLSFGWGRNGLSADVFVNYTGSYVYRGNSASPPFTLTRNSANVVTGGGQPVDSQTTIDMHVAYEFGGEGILGGAEFFLDGNNVFDEEPNAFNVAAGYDNFNANPIGRTLTVGIRKSW